MTVTAMIVILFSPDHNGINADNPFLGLSTNLLEIIYGVLYLIWLLTFILFALLGKWSLLRPIQKKCHFLASIIFIGLLNLPSIGITTLHPIPLSYQPITASAIVELLYLSIEITCSVVNTIGVLVQMFLRMIGGLLLAIRNRLRGQVRIRFNVNIG
ncbi:hypothetical protein ANO14919_079630 [Xylariales sp. No.14919]|nr:hypothetical protein ANO14919_079630 [Xylariales sp. No.14919]